MLKPEGSCLKVTKSIMYKKVFMYFSSVLKTTEYECLGEVTSSVNSLKNSSVSSF